MKIRDRKIDMGQITPEDRAKLSYRHRAQTVGEPQFLAEMPDLLWLATAIVMLMTLWLGSAVLYVAILGIFSMDISCAYPMLWRSGLGFAISIAVFGVLYGLIGKDNSTRKRKTHSGIKLGLLVAILATFVGLTIARSHADMLREQAALFERSGDYHQFRAEHALDKEVR